jgi:hypothetical protein
MKAQTLLLTYIIAILSAYIVYNMPLSIAIPENIQTITEILEYSEKIINGNKVTQIFYPYPISVNGQYYIINNNKVIHPLYQLYIDENTTINNCNINWYIKVENNIIKPVYYVGNLEKIGICDYGRIRIKYIVEPKKPLTEVVYFLSNYKGKISLINEIKGNVLYVDNTYGLTVIFDNLIVHYDDYTTYDNSHSIDVEKEFEVDNGTEVILHPEYSAQIYYAIKYYFQSNTNGYTYTKYTWKPLNGIIVWYHNYTIPLDSVNQWYYEWQKSFIVFNTSELPSDAVIQSAKVRLDLTLCEPSVDTPQYEIFTPQIKLQYINNIYPLPDNWNTTIETSSEENLPIKPNDYIRQTAYWTPENGIKEINIKSDLQIDTYDELKNFVILALDSDRQYKIQQVNYGKYSRVVFGNALLIVEYYSSTPSIKLTLSEPEITVIENTYRTTYASINLYLPPGNYTIKLITSSDKLYIEDNIWHYNVSEPVWTTLDATIKIKPLTKGTYTFTLKAIINDNESLSDTKTLTVNVIEQPKIISPSVTLLTIPKGGSNKFDLYVLKNAYVVVYSAPYGISTNLPSLSNPQIYNAGVYEVTVNASNDAIDGKLTILAVVSENEYQFVDITIDVVEAPTFTITFSQPSLIIKRGQSGSITGSVTSVSGYTGKVNLRATGNPPYSNITITPSSGNVPFNFTVNVTTTLQTPVGNYNITITGTDTTTSSTSFTLSVQEVIRRVEIDMYISPSKDNYYVGDKITVVINIRNTGEITYEGTLTLSYIVDNVEIETYSYDISLNVNDMTTIKKDITLDYEGNITFKSSIDKTEKSISITSLPPISKKSPLLSLLTFSLISIPSSLFYFKSKLEEIR